MKAKKLLFTILIAFLLTIGIILISKPKDTASGFKAGFESLK